jgi:hypothetical protein
MEVPWEGITGRRAAASMSHFWWKLAPLSVCRVTAWIDIWVIVAWIDIVRQAGLIL